MPTLAFVNPNPISKTLVAAKACDDATETLTFAFPKRRRPALAKPESITIGSNRFGAYPVRAGSPIPGLPADGENGGENDGGDGGGDGENGEGGEDDIPDTPDLPDDGEE